MYTYKDVINGLKYVDKPDCIATLYSLDNIKRSRILEVFYEPDLSNFVIYNNSVDATIAIDPSKILELGETYIGIMYKENINTDTNTYSIMLVEPEKDRYKLKMITWPSWMFRNIGPYNA